MRCPYPAIRPFALSTGILITALLSAQNFTDIGTGTLVNGGNQYPAPYGNDWPGARHQMLIRADEMVAAGMIPGDIVSVAFNVVNPAGAVLEGFTVSIGNTAASEMTEAWEQGLTPVWGPLDHTDVGGWNTHTFDTPFTWDGSSNIIVQTCFRSQNTSTNAQMFQTATTWASTTARNTQNTNVCTANTGTLVTYDQRPNIRFGWVPDPDPPVAAFTQSTDQTCDGVVSFTDATTGFPTAWEWDFGDGATSTEQNPTHTYTVDGTYTVRLIATNINGPDTVFGAPLLVSMNGPQPVAACVPPSTGTVAGIGIASVTIDGGTVSSPDAATEGYVDRSCRLDTTQVGSVLQLDVVTNTATAHNIRAWIDWDNSGTFISSELVLSANNAQNAGSTIQVPLFAVVNTPLRLRVMADYDFSPVPDPCVGPQYGQAEDYGVVVLPNDNAPEAAFTVEPTLSCNGSVQFTDGSLFAPTSWTWDFGDGNGSNDQSPVHTYANSGTYTVSLVVSNAAGNDTVVVVDAVTIDLAGQLLPASCTPQTVAYCCGFGITAFSFAGINTTSPDGAEGYVDRSCGNVAQVTEGLSYPISVGTGGSSAHDVYMWMDLNNDGTFGAGELIWSALNAQNPAATLTMPSGVVFGTPLRLRVSADVVGELSGPCDGPSFGQTEDYTVVVTANPAPPVAAFSAVPETTCTGFVQFTDGSTNAPDSWSWDFGDGNTSTVQSPLHEYAGPGVYTVTLTVTNENGSDTEVASNLITYIEPAFCDTLTMPGFQDASSESCEGVLADDGGPDGAYGPFETAAFTIAPADAEVVVLTFSQFNWGNNDNRVLAIYDGPTVFDTPIGTFNGNGLGQLPNNGVIVSSGPAITLRQEVQGGGPPPNASGFLLTWSCSYTGVGDAAVDPVSTVWPNPADDLLNVRFAQPAGRGWTATLSDVTGARVRQEALTGAVTDHSLDVSTLAPGAYVLTVNTPQGRWNRTIVIR